MSLVGSYKLKKDIRARTGFTVFTMPKGTKFKVKQHDKFHFKVLIEFGDGYIDWFNESWLKSYAEAE